MPLKHRLSRKTKVQALQRGSRYDHLQMVDSKLTGKKRRKALQKLYVLRSRGQVELPKTDAEAEVCATGRVIQSAEAVAIPCGSRGRLFAARVARVFGRGRLGFCRSTSLRRVPLAVHALKLRWVVRSWGAVGGRRPQRDSARGMFRGTCLSRRWSDASAGGAAVERSLERRRRRLRFGSAASHCRCQDPGPDASHLCHAVHGFALGGAPCRP